MCGRNAFKASIILPVYVFQSNIEYVNFLNEILEREIPRTIRAFPFGENAIFNYSTQALNSAEIAKKLLRQEMAKARKQDLSFIYLRFFSKISTWKSLIV